MVKYASLLALALTAAAVPSPSGSAEGISVPVNSNHYEPRADGTFDEKRFRNMLQKTLDKYGYNIQLPEDLFEHLRAALRERGYEDESDVIEERATGKVPLTDQVETGKIDELYYGNGNVGGQAFTIDFDTGSADFFVPGPNCTGCSKKGNTYDEGGVNRHKTTSVTYGSGTISGNDYYDTVTVGGLSAPKTNVISLKSAQGFSSADSNSLMGMGFSTIASSKSPTFFERLIALGKVTKHEFSFYLGRAKSGTAGKSELFLGGKNPAKYTGALTSHKVTKKGYWQVAIDGGFADNGTASGPGQAAIDTGTTIILGSTSAVTPFMTTQFGAVPVPGVGGTGITLFSYKCSSKKTLGLSFSGKKYEINPLDTNFGQLASLPILGGMCVACIAAADLNPPQVFYVVGDSFIKNWYSVFDYSGPSVSFAKSV